MAEALGMESKQSEAAVSGRSLRILVVDDDSLSQGMLDILLSQQGYKAEFASNGSEALQAIKSQKFDLVFMDLFLPDMNGHDVCRQVREWEAGKSRVPIVALTAYDVPGQPLEMLKSGMDDYIFKPYDIRQIARMICVYTGEARQASSGSGDSEDRDQLVDTEALILDCQRALLVFSDNVSDYKSLLANFIAGLSQRLERMHHNYESGAFRELARESHNLKSVSASLGAMQLSRLATRLERASDDRQTVSSGQLLQQIDKGAQALRSEADTFLSS